MHKGFFRRLAALTRKETLELLRDQSSLLMGVVLPLILILIIGYGLSLDVKNVPTAVVLEVFLTDGTAVCELHAGLGILPPGLHAFAGGSRTEDAPA